ncbi:uncharacterized protein LOC129800061 [Phlebotomus papatasi]|uniref:uncharacterized protein LOC129800061 n=1 Tax=Phlebotomus papatasi TaxID=29031 RepID=UPI0024838B8F|nr:uncharacterized protein LOC129800061 [Phlebotomus papatasi]
MMSTTLPSCMDRYMNRYMVPPATHHQLNHQTPPVGQPYFHQNAVGGGNGAGGVTGTPAIVAPNQPSQTNTGGAFMMNCYQNANGWTGVPLISTASRRPRKQQQQHHTMPPSNKPPPPATQTGGGVAPSSAACDFDESAMSRLAIHAHGAPLILTGRGYHRKPPLVRHPQPMQKIPPQACYTPQRMDEFGGNVYENGNRQLGHPTGHPIVDTFSMVNSDESSSTSSSNSHTPDTCLPRIIKPRKRRKKERKPTCQNPNVTSMLGSMPVKNNCTNANNGVPMKSLPLVTSTATQTTIQEFGADKKNSGSTTTTTMGMMSAQDELQFADLGDGGDLRAVNGADEVTEEMSSCSCRLCDPFCRIWAFPLRRSCSDNSGEVEATRRNVGVIGSHIKSSSGNEWRSTPQLCNQQQVYGTNIDGSRKGSLSDSGDSGCDLLSGLNFATDDLLSIVDGADGGSGGGGGKNMSTPPDDRVCDFLLTDNCWEILSRRVMESLDLRSDETSGNLAIGGGSSTGAKVTGGSDCVSSDSGSVFSDSVFSDGIPECYANEQTPHLGVQIANLLLDQPQLPIFSGCYPEQHFGNNHQRKSSGIIRDSTPLFLQEKDRGNEILSCLDMVWNGASQLMPVEE